MINKKSLALLLLAISFSVNADVLYTSDNDIYQQLSQKASPNTGGDEWLCSLFLRTHFLC